jgi:hypothetical protein
VKDSTFATGILPDYGRLRYGRPDRRLIDGRSVADEKEGNQANRLDRQPRELLSLKSLEQLSLSGTRTCMGLGDVCASSHSYIDSCMNMQNSSENF